MSFGAMHPPAFESSVNGANPDLGKFAVDRLLLHANLAIENYGLPPAGSIEWHYITHSKFMGLLTRLPDHAARVLFGPSAVHMHQKLTAFFNGYYSEKRAPKHRWARC